MTDEKISFDKALQMIPEIHLMLTKMNENYLKISSTPVEVYGKSEAFINTIEAARLLGIGKGTLYQLTMRNSIPFYKTGKKLLFSANELTEFIKSKRNETSSERTDNAGEYIKNCKY